MRVVVTGAAGFLGENLVRVLLEEPGHTVSGLVRPGGASPAVEVPCSEVDLAAGALPGGVFAGIDLVIHLAGLYSARATDLGAMRLTNVAGTRAVLDAAVRDGVSRVVHCSTMGTCVSIEQAGPATEDDRIDPAAASPYHVTKLEGEELALAEDRIEVVVVNPAAPVGRFDRKPTVTGQRIRDIAEGRWPRLLAGPVNHVSATACVRGMLLAGKKGRPGERYLLGGEDVPPEELLARVAAAAGRSIPRRPFLWRLRGKGRPSAGSLSIDDSKARRELGYDPGNLEAAFRDAVSWFQGV
ncbi:MAG: NAD-dependent epimerase/dehydratase family protein [Planctomycetes bacterium]|nr:NAD-dependent epimerase/dehydratase family protein [Planctomycetota bacterium]